MPSVEAFINLFELSDNDIRDEYHRRFSSDGQSDRFDVPGMELRLTSMEASRINRAIEDQDRATVFEIIKQYFETVEATDD